ncbi:MAG TPA: hypothetical protein VLE74_00365 [Candidatus Saccharimonadales bacterium]|nr:hypothetical protein [Candidatus Saccharimonadales bacterium]
MPKFESSEVPEESVDVRVLRTSNPIRDAIREATFGTMEDALAIARGEQPDSPALPADGALGGDAPLPSADKENK